jgi:hypothetical protein
MRKRTLCETRSALAVLQKSTQRVKEDADPAWSQDTMPNLPRPDFMVFHISICMYARTDVHSKDTCGLKAAFRSREQGAGAQESVQEQGARKCLCDG